MGRPAAYDLLVDSQLDGAYRGGGGGTRRKTGSNRIMASSPIGGWT
jgi:hypothetical protein